MENDRILSRTIDEALRQSLRLDAAGDPPPGWNRDVTTMAPTRTLKKTNITAPGLIHAGSGHQHSLVVAIA
jgi:hypothetical protein